MALMAVTLLVSACSSPTPVPTEVELPSLPTPDVPPIEEVDKAIDTWENSQVSNYFIEVEEETQSTQFIIRLVVVDDEIRVAQRLDLDNDGAWGEPYSIPHAEAEAYTVDSLLARIRADVLGEGNSLFNIVAAFNDSLGYPLLTHAEALPTYTESGTLELNRQHSYDIVTNFKTLLEEVYGTGIDPIFTFIRSDGPEAWCDNLRIYPDGSSIFVDDCRNEFWRIPTPRSRLEILDELRSNFDLLDDTRELEGQVQHLVITGTGQGKPDTDMIEEAWQLTAELHDILSEPTGLGLVMSYVYDGEFFGFDIFNKITLPSQLTKSGDLKGASLTPDGDLLAYSDDVGLSIFTLETQEATELLPPPEDGYYLPRSWSKTGRLFASQYPNNEAGQIQHGWLEGEDAIWHNLPTPQGVPGYGCDTGASWSPDGGQIAITGLGYGESCNVSPGLTIININSNSAEVIVAPQINSLEGEGTTLTAGAHTPAWSPDGNWIAFGLDHDPDDTGNFPIRLYRAHPDGTNLTPLTSNSHGYATHPAWAPDGSLFYGLSGADAELDGLYHYLPAENTHTLLLPGPGIHPLSVSPDGEFLLYEQDGSLKIWRVRLMEIVAEITGDEDQQPTFSGWIEITREQ